MKNASIVTLLLGLLPLTMANEFAGAFMNRHVPSANEFIETPIVPLPNKFFSMPQNIQPPTDDESQDALQEANNSADVRNHDSIDLNDHDHSSMDAGNRKNSAFVYRDHRDPQDQRESASASMSTNIPTLLRPGNQDTDTDTQADMNTKTTSNSASNHAYDIRYAAARNPAAPTRSSSVVVLVGVIATAIALTTQPS